MSIDFINEPIRIMIVDDSAVIRNFLFKALETTPEIKIVASAANGKIALDYLKKFELEIVLLDIEMPIMDGLSALPELRKIKPDLQIIMVSSLTQENSEFTIKALNSGASDFILKPSSHNSNSLITFNKELIEKIKALGGAYRRHTAVKLKPNINRYVENPTKAAHTIKKKFSAIAIASSTGGPQALLKLLYGFKKEFIKNFPIFITQHMPPFFTQQLAMSIAKSTGLVCKEAQNDEKVESGIIYIAPGGYHMLAEKKDSNIYINLSDGPAENFCKPAADPMLRSLTTIYQKNLLILVLTGMGKDGLEGSKIAVKQGATIIAQDEASSIVWGMPGAIAAEGIADSILPIDQIAKHIQEL
ncbi:MAG: chemotaxis response regulator protein-glutamate methylesterase [Alphaproteobacteria bacterium]